MSRLEELIQELCPNGVEYKIFSEVCRFQNGFAFSSSKFSQKGLPILRITNISDGIITNKNYVYFNKDDYLNINFKPYEVKKGDVVVAMSGATTGKIGINLTDDIYYLNQRVGLFVPNETVLNKKYMYYWLCNVSDDILNISTGSGAQPNLSSIKMMEFKIPVPPMEVQCEIVHILDQFTLLTAELTAELTARKQQYEYYREFFLFPSNFENVFSKVCLGDVTKIGDGLHSTPIYKENQEYYFINGNNLKNGVIQIDDKTKTVNYLEYIKYKKDFDYETILMSINGTVGNVSIYNGENIVLGKSVAYFIVNKQKLNYKYLFYYLQTNKSKNYYFNQATGSTIINLGLNALRNYIIYLPSLEEQQRIVDILDKFDAYCNDLTQGLPAEIELRKQQYEYYRDKLLSFKELK